ncbi:MAG: nucleotidyltransferase family protein [Erysipelotrichales bacterium]|nr:nucleotidyltransferase family protein [Erysipelotrichales bacterium]
MKSCGIVCEYNPFHSGHAYHLEQARLLSGADVMIGVMCDHFVQRGEVPCVSAKERSLEALRHGMNLVVELPYPYCLESADHYAQGAIQVLERLQCDMVCFGSESNSLEVLQEQVAKQEEIEYDPSLSYLQQGSLSTSNDILGTAYLKAIRNTTITPITIQRTNTYQSHALNSTHASATTLRESKREGKDISQYTHLQEYMEFIDLEAYYPYIQLLLFTLPQEYLSNIFLMNEGIENLLAKNAREYATYTEFLEHNITKKYTKARIQRTLWHLLLQTSQEESEMLMKLSFVRVLAADEKGLAYLNSIKKSEGLQLVSKFSALPEEYQRYIHRVHGLLHTHQSKCWEEELAFPYIINHGGN